MSPGIPEAIQEISGPERDDRFLIRFANEEDRANTDKFEELPAVGLVGMVTAQRTFDPSLGRDGVGVNLYLPSSSRWAITSFRREFMSKVDGARSGTIPPTQEQRDLMAAEEREVLEGALDDLSEQDLQVLGAFLVICDDSDPPVTGSQLLISKPLQERWDFLLRDKALRAKETGQKPKDAVEEAEISERSVLNPNMQSFAVLTLARLMTDKTLDIPRHLFRLASQYSR